MKVLVIETTPATPHAETSLEIAIKETLAGSKVVYCPVFHLLPNLIWRSNINGRSSGGRADSIEDWLKYLLDILRPYVEVDVFALKSVPDYLTESMKNNIFDFIFDSHQFGALVKSNAVQLFDTTDYAFLLAEHREACESLAQTAILSYELSLNLIRKHEPDVVYFFNGRTVATWPIFLACQELGVKPLVHERGSTKDRYSISDRPPQFVDLTREQINDFSLGRSEDAARLSAAVFYYRQRSGRITNFAFSNSAQDHDADVDIPGRRDRFVAYFASSNNEIVLMPTQDVSNTLGSQSDAIATLAHVCNEEGIQLIIRMHPGCPKSEYGAYDQFSDGERCMVIPPHSSVSSYRLGATALRNFSYGSTITWEFLYSGIGCAVLSRTVGSDEAGVIELASAGAIRQYLRDPLPAVDPSFSIKYADFMNNYGERYDFYRAETLFSGTFSTALSAAL